MKLIIDIPDEEYQWIKDYPSVYSTPYHEQIRNGKPYEEKQQGRWFEHIDKGLLKARHGDYVLYKVDFLLDNLAREVNIMESARQLGGDKK